MQSTSWETLDWKKHKLESRLLGEISVTSNMQMTPPLCRKWRGTKEPLDEGERGEGKSWLKTQHSRNKDHAIQSHHFMSDRWGNNGNSDRVFSWAPKSLQMVTLAMKLNLLLGRKAMTNLYYSVLKSRDITDKGPSSQSYGFSSSHVWMWELGYKESWAPKNWCFWTVVLEENPLDCKEIQPVHPKRNQSQIFIGRTDAETPITLATWCEEMTHWKRPWCWESL